jgi:sugar (pentulose or hexulose) kinase
MQSKADIINRPIDVPAVEEATPLGAAILAGIGAGLYTDAQDAFKRVYKQGKTYEPDPDRAEQYEERFRIYMSLYPTLMSLNHRIAGL